jgi:uncharacterized protein (DUF952 family)
MIFKITDTGSWQNAERSGYFLGSSDDLRDGFIHFSTAAQVKATAEKYFTGRNDLLLVAFDESGFGNDLKWEPSRGGDLFPHLYAKLPAAAALWCRELALDPQGVPQIPDDLLMGKAKC